MTTLIPTSNLQEQRVVLPSVTWQQYESLLATLGDYPGLRLIYLAWIIHEPVMKERGWVGLGVRSRSE